MKTNILFSILLFFFTFSINAQTPDSISQVVPNDDLDVSLGRTTITAAEIRERGYDNLDELLASVQGIFISHDRTLTQIGIRGPSPTATNNQRVKVLLNNIPLNNPFSGQAPSGFDLGGINMEDIEEVIIIRNPSPIEDGNNAMLGVIKINTKKAKKGGRINIDTGSFGEVDGGFSVGQSFGKTNIGLSGRIARIGGEELYLPEDSNLDKEESNFGGLQLQVNHGKFSFTGFYNQRDESVYGLTSDPVLRYDEFDTTMVSEGFKSYQNSIDTMGNFKEKQLYADLRFSTPYKSNQHIDLRFFVNYENQQREQYFQDNIFEFILDTVVGVDSSAWSQLNYFENPNQKNLWLGIGYQHSIQFTPNHQIKFGTDLQALPFSKFENNLQPTFYEFIPDNESTSTDFPDNVLAYLNIFSDSVFLDENFFDYWSTAFFIQDQIRLNEKIAIKGGVRLNVNSQTKPVFAPELKFIFTPFSEKTNIQLGYSQGFRLPSILETNVSQIDDGTATARDLIPEKSNNFELGFWQKVGKDLELNLSLYHQELNDLIWNEKMMMNRQNDEIIRTTGLEGGLNVNLLNGVKTYINYNFPFQKQDEDKVNMPAPLCKFGVTIPFLTHFSIFTEGQYEGSRLTFDGGNTRPYFLMNTNLLIRPRIDESQPAAKWLNHISVAFRVFNLWDQFYEHPSGRNFTAPLIPQNGRTWQTQLTYQF